MCHQRGRSRPPRGYGTWPKQLGGPAPRAEFAMNSSVIDSTGFNLNLFSERCRSDATYISNNSIYPVVRGKIVCRKNACQFSNSALTNRTFQMHHTKKYRSAKGPLKKVIWYTCPRRIPNFRSIRRGNLCRDSSDRALL